MSVRNRPIRSLRRVSRRLRDALRAGRHRHRGSRRDRRGRGAEVRRRGAAVVAVDLPGSDLDGTAAVVEAAGGKLTAVTADVRTESDVAAYVATTLDTHGKVDALFNNAGIEGPVVPLVDYPTDDFDRVMAVNVPRRLAGPQARRPAIAASGGGAIVTPRQWRA